MFGVGTTLPDLQCRNNLFQIANNTNYDLRSNGNDFLLQKPKTNYMKKCITYKYKRAIAWNKLPNNVKAKIKLFVGKKQLSQRTLIKEYTKCSAR